MVAKLPIDVNHLTEFRAVGDQPADLFVQSAFEMPESKLALREFITKLNSNAHLLQQNLPFADEPLINAAGQLPEWANGKLMKRGTDFFAMHAPSIMNLLGLLSLPYCYTAANGAMVLAISGRMDMDTGKRLYETAEFVWDVMAPDAFESKGRGFAAILKVRLMHAAARYYTLKSDKWEASFGLPVNQEDMAGTNLSFSLLVIRGLRKLGLVISYEDQQAFMHLWNIVGFKLGVDPQLLPTDGKEAVNLAKAIEKSQFKSSAHGQELTRRLIAYVTSAITDAPVSKAEISQLMRYLLEDDVADLLGIPSPKITSVKLSVLRNLNFFKDFISINNASKFQTEFYQFKRNKIG